MNKPLPRPQVIEEDGQPAFAVLLDELAHLGNAR